MTKPRWVLELLSPLQSFPQYLFSRTILFLFESRTFFLSRKQNIFGKLHRRREGFQVFLEWLKTCGLSVLYPGRRASQGEGALTQALSQPNLPNSPSNLWCPSLFSNPRFLFSNFSLKSKSKLYVVPLSFFCVFFLKSKLMECHGIVLSRIWREGN